MNVRVTDQFLSESVSVDLITFGLKKAAATGTYCEMFDKFFVCVNGRNSVEYITKRKPFLSPYFSVDDEKLSWVVETFLPYFQKWKESGGP